MAEPYAHLAAENGFLRADFRLLTSAEGGRDGALVIGDDRANWSVGTPYETGNSAKPGRRRRLRSIRAAVRRRVRHAR